ncbi:hypothetical protein QYE76_049256 [Lolium multiflorum]|uniref:Reverse transcriptase domain-containing protein n=1 Tax=Lolium multiflorum TaxID=4521 RepID=A0AAD8SPB7_LOLMU|nr:hypothetical protein QYE76_049256 [Lolium multiflorum]
MAKFVRKTRDLNQVKCIKDEANQLLVKDEEIKNKWREYFDGLFNDGNGGTMPKLDDSFDDTNRHFVRRIQELEVKEAHKRMKGGKSLGPDDISIEVWRSLGDVAIVWLTKLFNNIFQSSKMPKERRKSILVLIFKNKRDIQSYNNYQGIKLMSHTMKLWERIIDHRLRRVTNVTKNQFGFMPGRSTTTEVIFLLRQLIERYREEKKDLHMVFIDLEKAYDKIPRTVMWWLVGKHKVPTKYITLIRDMYDHVVTSVRAGACSSSLHRDPSVTCDKKMDSRCKRRFTLATEAILERLGIGEVGQLPAFSVLNAMEVVRLEDTNVETYNTAMGTIKELLQKLIEMGVKGDGLGPVGRLSAKIARADGNVAPIDLEKVPREAGYIADEPRCCSSCSI